MPYADTEEQKDYYRRYQADHRERINRLRRERYQAEKAKEGQTVTCEPVKKTKRSKPSMVVDKRQRWVVNEGRVFTNSQLGFTVEDLVQMTQELVQHRAKEGRPMVS